MDITLFSKPETHPYDMLRDREHAYEKETVLRWVLSKCIEAGAFVAVETHHTHPTMVRDGLLEEVEDGKYKLTTRSIGLLYSVYGKMEGGLMEEKEFFPITAQVIEETRKFINGLRGADKSLAAAAHEGRFSMEAAWGLVIGAGIRRCSCGVWDDVELLEEDGKPLPCPHRQLKEGN